MLDAMHPAPPPPARGTTEPVVFYSRPGCHLCADAHAVLSALLAERAAAGRPAPPIVERDITSDPDWERRFLVTIPVIEVGAQRLELATSPVRIRALLDAALDAPGVADAEASRAVDPSARRAAAPSDGRP
jgi:hypothetical protein